MVALFAPFLPQLSYRKPQSRVRSVSGKMQPSDVKIKTCPVVPVGSETISVPVQVGFLSVAAALLTNTLAARIGPIRGGVVVDLLQRFVLTPFDTASAHTADAYSEF